MNGSNIVLFLKLQTLQYDKHDVGSKPNIEGTSKHDMNEGQK